MGYAAEYLIGELPDDFLVICDVNSLTHRLRGVKPEGLGGIVGLGDCGIERLGDLVIREVAQQNRTHKNH